MEKILQPLPCHLARIAEAANSRDGIVTLGNVTGFQRQPHLLFWRKMDRNSRVVLCTVDSLRTLTHEHAIVFFTTPQGFFDSLALCNINQQSSGQPLAGDRIAQNHQLISQPDFVSVAATHAVLDVEWTAFLPCIFLRRYLMIFGVKVLPPETWVCQALFGSKS